MSKGWDNAMLKKLKSLTGKGLSTAEIGKRLGLSKNAVVGKLNRLGWNSKANGVAEPAPAKAPEKKTAPKPAPKKAAAPAKPTPKATAPKPAPKAKAAPKTASAKSAPVAKGASKSGAKNNLAMHQRIIQHSLEMAALKPNQCRWPIGDPDSEDFHFCGDAVFVGKPYCYEHCKQAYQFTPPKKK